MNLIFLDIDGVFVTHRSWLGTRGKKRSGRSSEFDPIAMEMIRKLCERTDSKIVVCSSWRKISVMENGNSPQNILYKTFKKAGLVKYVLMPSWRTPCMASQKRPDDFPKAKKWEKWGTEENCIRGDEVNRWLDINGKDVKNYCIIDDEYDYTDHQIENTLVQTDMEEGFLYRHYQLAEKILTEN